MALAAKLEMRQGQQLVMTPQLQQAIKLLQLSNIELTAFVEAELERNPLLEREETDSVENIAAPAAEDNSQKANGADGEDEPWLNLRETATGTTDLDTDYENVYADTTAAEVAGALQGNWSATRPAKLGEGHEANLEAYVSSEKSLKDHLLEHLQLTVRDPADLLIGRYIIDMVDEAGYIVGNLDEVAEKLIVEPERVETVLRALQTCDPAGIPARGLAECLMLQLKDRNRYDPVIASVLDNLDLLAAHKLNQLKRTTGIGLEDLSEIVAELKALDPKPGLQFGSTTLQPVVPDVLVRPARDGSWIIELNNDTLPRVLVDRSYYAKVSKCARSHGDKDYLQDCLQTANWLVKSLDQRARTILRVSEEIVRQQDGFFTHGVQYLRPLNLKTVAEAISMHESTISRVTSNKYMATPRGILELKYFFSSAIASADDGDAHSSEAVRHRIRSMVDAETPDSILSDDKIVDRLKAEGVDIARRTVAKYREVLRIPSSVQRRREKRLQLQF
ncbi:MAG: RNA polymerase factor sigma-54 [Hyphomicrobiaceae bacterium]